MTGNTYDAAEKEDTDEMIRTIFWTEEVRTMAWTDEQQEAIDSRKSNAAPVGSCRLGVRRPSWSSALSAACWIRRIPIDITELLVVTFTNAAAAEMRDRVGQALMKALSETKDPRIERQLALLPSAHIFDPLHSFCQYVIRKVFLYH